MINSQLRFGSVMAAYVVVGVGNAVLGTKFPADTWQFWVVALVSAATVIASKLSPGSLQAQDKGKDPSP